MTTIGEAASELREDVPLNRQSSKSGGLCGSCSEDCLGGSKFINAAFGTLTAVITIALVVQIYYGDYQVVPHGSVATDNFKCSKIGTSILKQGGNAIDAAVASTFCLSVVAPHLTSLDAEGQVLIYNHRTRELPDFIDFSGPELTSGGIPRLVLGLAYLHHLYCTISWKDLVQPSVDLARNGFFPSKMFLQALNQSHAESLFGNIKTGQKMALDALADTLEKIADIAEDDLYSHLTPDNQPIHTDAVKVKLNNYNIYIPGSPSIGPYLAINLHQIEMLNFSVVDVGAPEYVFNIANVTQTVIREMIDTKFHIGTSSNVAAIDLADNYISLVTGMYQHFGSGIVTDGYISDVRGKTLPCTRIPIIITDSNVVCGRRMVLGANDIATATQIISSLVVGKENVTESAEAPRFIISDGYSIGIEGSHTPIFKDNVLNLLANLKSYQVTEPYFSSNIVEKFKDDLTSHSDSRGGGIASRF